MRPSDETARFFGKSRGNRETVGTTQHAVARAVVLFHTHCPMLRPGYEIRRIVRTRSKIQPLTSRRHDRKRPDNEVRAHTAPLGSQPAPSPRRRQRHRRACRFAGYRFKLNSKYRLLGTEMRNNFFSFFGGIFINFFNREFASFPFDSSSGASGFEATTTQARRHARYAHIEISHSYGRCLTRASARVYICIYRCGPRIRGRV